MDALLIVIPHAAVTACMRTDRSGNERKCIFLKDDLKRILTSTLLHRTQIRRNILMNRTSALTGRVEAVHERKALFLLPGWKRFHTLAVPLPGQSCVSQFTDLFDIHSLPFIIRDILQELPDLIQSLISARLKQGGCHRDRPDTRRDQIPDAEVVSAARIGDPKLSVKLLRDSLDELNRQRIEAASGHIHLLARELAGLHIHREGIRQLDSDRKSKAFGKADQTLKHRNGILPLKVRRKMMIVKGNVIKSQVIECLSREVISQQRRIALYISIQVLFLKQVGSNRLDLLRGTSVQC